MSTMTTSNRHLRENQKRSLKGVDLSISPYPSRTATQPSPYQPPWSMTTSNSYSSRRDSVDFTSFPHVANSSSESPLSSADTYSEATQFPSLFTTISHSRCEPEEELDPEDDSDSEGYPDPEDEPGSQSMGTNKNKRTPLSGKCALEICYIRDLFGEEFKSKVFTNIYGISRNTSYVSIKRKEKLLQTPIDKLGMSRNRTRKDHGKASTRDQLCVRNGKQMASFVLSTLLCQPYIPGIDAFEQYIPHSIKGGTFEAYKKSFKEYLEKIPSVRNLEDCIFEDHMLIFISSLFKSTQRYFCELAMETKVIVGGSCVHPKNMAFFIASNGAEYLSGGAKVQVDRNSTVEHKVFFESLDDLEGPEGQEDNKMTFESWLKWLNDCQQEEMLLYVDWETLKALCPSNGPQENPVLTQYSRIQVLGIPVRLAQFSPLKNAAVSVGGITLNMQGIERPQAVTYRENLRCALINGAHQNNIVTEISNFNLKAGILQEGSY
ncbi:hypothetical protein BGZ76_000357 [Entomortierella beljakovae]|nr:hypothetical protein BGZ76_000357 [Entomortierella beljakovae]